MDLEELKKILNELKENGIYNYKEKINYFQIFTSIRKKRSNLFFNFKKKS